MKKNAFTLVELLAVIIVIAIVLVIAVPRLTNISGGADKEKFKINSNEIYNLVKSDFLSYHGGKVSNESIMYMVTSMEIKENSRVLDTNLKENIDGYVEVDTSGDTKALLENDKFCMIKEYSDSNLKIYPIDSSECTITGKVLFVFNLNGGELVSSSFSLTGTYSPNTQLSYPSIKKEGYALRKWQLEKGDALLGENNITIGNKNSTITAMWGKEVNLTVDLDGGILSDSLQSVYAEGSEVTLPSPTKTDYVFTGWKVVSGNAIISGNTLHFGTTDVTIKATYRLNTSSLVLDFDGGDTSGDVSGTYTINEKVTLPSPTKPGYDFNGWQVISGNGALSGNVITIGNQNTKVKATYKSKKYVVTLNANGGEISSNVLTVSYGAPYENLPTPTRQYYNFLGWYTDSEGGELVNNTSLVSIAANHVLYARWESALLNVTYEYLINNYSCAGTTKGTPVFTYTGTCEILDDSSVLAGAWRIKFKTSGNLTFSSIAAIDAFLVGGGGSGGDGDEIYNEDYSRGGGGGGYTRTDKRIIIEKDKIYPIVIGAGGASKSNGGATTAFDVSAKGGVCANQYGDGGAGGSGGGAHGGDKDDKIVAGKGGSYGNSGVSANNSRGGAGQGTPTCEFDEGTLSGCTRGDEFAYSGGGGGGSRWNNWANVIYYAYGGVGGGGRGGYTIYGSSNGTNGTANTGGGGGGGVGSTKGGAGGSGVVVIRNAR